MHIINITYVLALYSAYSDLSGNRRNVTIALVVNILERGGMTEARYAMCISALIKSIYNSFIHKISVNWNKSVQEKCRYASDQLDQCTNIK